MMVIRVCFLHGSFSITNGIVWITVNTTTEYGLLSNSPIQNETVISRLRRLEGYAQLCYLLQRLDLTNGNKSLELHNIHVHAY